MSAQPWRNVPLRLPVDDDTVFEIPPISYADGLTLRQLLNDGTTVGGLSLSSDDDELAKLCVGQSTWALLLESGPTFPVMFRAGMAAIQYQIALVMGQECDAAAAAGEKVWESGLNPEAVAAVIAAAMQGTTPEAPQEPTPQTEELRPVDPVTSTSSISTESASGTPSPASTSPTTSPEITPPTGPTTSLDSTPSPGDTSSSTGT